MADEAVGVLAGVAGRTEGTRFQLELLLLPLSHGGRNHVRMLGGLAPLLPSGWQGNQATETLALSSVRYLGAAAEAGRGRRFLTRPRDNRPDLVVYDGGRL